MQPTRPARWCITLFDIIVAIVAVLLVWLMVALPDWDGDGKPRTTFTPEAPHRATA